MSIWKKIGDIAKAWIKAHVFDAEHKEEDEYLGFCSECPGMVHISDGWHLSATRVIHDKCGARVALKLNIPPQSLIFANMTTRLRDLKIADVDYHVKAAQAWVTRTSSPAEVATALKNLVPVVKRAEKLVPATRDLVVHELQVAGNALARIPPSRVISHAN